MDTIRELFYGNIHPYERDISKDSEGDKLNKLIIRHDVALKATLNEQAVEESNAQPSIEYDFDNAYSDYLNNDDNGYDDNVDDEDEEYYGLSM